MAGQYLDVEFQNTDGDVVYPHSNAATTWMQDGRSAEEAIKCKAEMVISKVAIPVENRKEGVMYAFIEGESASAKAAVVRASPAVGYKVI